MNPYGSGSFGEWIDDEGGLPAFRYTCNQSNDPRAVTQVITPGILMPAEHVHQVGNDRLVAMVSNYGHVQVRQDEGGPKFLNVYSPQRSQYSGLGWLIGDNELLGTWYPSSGVSFDRIFGIGYFRKTVTGNFYSVDQVIVAPFGDDPVLLSQVTISNLSAATANLRWVEYWGCHVYQFSYRSNLEAFGNDGQTASLRYAFGDQFAHQFELLPGGAGLLENKAFLGRTASEEALWQAAVDYWATHSSPWNAPIQEGVPGSSFEDLNPPATFLASLDAPADAVATNGAALFANLSSLLNSDISSTGNTSCLALERRLTLGAGEQRTLYFLYGYLPAGADVNELIGQYRSRAATVWTDSSTAWSNSGLRFETPLEPWAARETTWNYYYVRSALTYDAFFNEHILSQGGYYQYVTGFQGAARDPLQHSLPLLFSDPQLMKEVLRYTLKEVRADGSIPYAIVGHGTIMPTPLDNASDLPMWLLWTVSEYVLATRDSAFLDEQIPGLLLASPGADTVRSLLARCYHHLIQDVGTGEHHLMRMLNDDWDDGLVGSVGANNLSECVALGESVLNSAMAAWVLDCYARLLAFLGDQGTAEGIQKKAEEHRLAARAQWTGQWLRRAWLGPTLGWLGDDTLWLEQHPSAIIGGVTTRGQARVLVRNIDQLLRQPSTLGAMILGPGPDGAVLGIDVGTSMNRGISPTLNGWLVWALAVMDVEAACNERKPGPLASHAGTCRDISMAWDEWKRDSLARHAEVYPDIWYETWSGPDTINSALSKYPGATASSEYLPYTTFPVMNLHSHAWPLYALTKLLGVRFTADGVELAPMIPLDSYRFESQLLGLVKSPNGYEGWYSPAKPGLWTIRLRLPEHELVRIVASEIDDRRQAPLRSANEILLADSTAEGKPLRWAVHFC
ncbi:MAG: hypothetical protein ABSH47_14900 [Bryobacteraceae bacterium]